MPVVINALHIFVDLPTCVRQTHSSPGLIPRAVGAVDRGETEVREELRAPSFLVDSVIKVIVIRAIGNATCCQFRLF